METKIPPFALEDSASETQRFMTRVYGWMSICHRLARLIGNVGGKF